MKRLMHLSLVGALTTMITLSGCATLFSGTSEMVSITSTPAGATVTINGSYMGTTPLSLSMKKDKDLNVLLHKDGYKDATAAITRSFNPVAILNLLGLLCWVVDAVTGALWKFDQSGINVQLEAISGKKSSSLIKGNSRLIAGAGMTAVEKDGKTFLLFNARTAQ